MRQIPLVGVGQFSIGEKTCHQPEMPGQVPGSSHLCGYPRLAFLDRPVPELGAHPTSAAFGGVKSCLRPILCRATS
ncbi:hypothetical protein MRX96_007878 [Rhipicephalus microplus]